MTATAKEREYVALNAICETNTIFLNHRPAHNSHRQHNDYDSEKERESMNKISIALLIIILLTVIPSCIIGNTTPYTDTHSQKIPSWCDEHPFWNLCRHNENYDPWNTIKHDLQAHSPTPQPATTDKSRLEKCEEIVKNYNETHIYEKHTFDCDDMTLDIWNQLKKEYINAKIGLGNVTCEVDNLWEASHAWVIAEYEPNQWIALEGVGGHVISKDDNPLYYTGWFFDSPMEYKKYRELAAQYKEEMEDFNRLLTDNNSSLSEEDRKKKEILIEDYTKKRLELEEKIIALSQGVKASNLYLFGNKTHLS